MSHDVVIIGGGVIGLTTAYYLARDGARVAVVDRGPTGKEASWAGAGILPPSNLATARTPFDQLRGLSQQLFPNLCADLAATTGIESGYWVCGGLELARGRSAATLHEEWCGAGVASIALSEDQVLQREPELAPGLGPGALLPDLAQVRNPHHLSALAAACSRAGVAMHTQTEVHTLRATAATGAAQRRIAAAVASSGEINGGQYVICAGAWSERLLEQLDWRPGIRPVRGQIALLKPDRPLLRHVLLWGSQYLVPRRDGRVLIGSTEEEVGFDKRTTAQAIGGLIELGLRLVPALASAEVEAGWAGLRPGSPDGLPYLGPLPGWTNAWVAAGHFRAGLQLSTGSALLLKEMLLGKTTTVDVSPYRPGR